MISTTQVRARFALRTYISTLTEDSKTNANRLAAASQEHSTNVKPDKDISDEAAASQVDPTAPARMHGNKPSRGAEIDAEIQAEEEATLRK